MEYINTIFAFGAFVMAFFAFAKLYDSSKEDMSYNIQIEDLLKVLRQRTNYHLDITQRTAEAFDHMVTQYDLDIKEIMNKLEKIQTDTDSHIANDSKDIEQLAANIGELMKGQKYINDSETKRYEEMKTAVTTAIDDAKLLTDEKLYLQKQHYIALRAMRNQGKPLSQIAKELNSTCTDLARDIRQGDALFTIKITEPHEN